MAVSIAILPWVRFDFNPMHLRDPNGPAMRTLADLMRDPDRTPNTISVLAPNADEATALAARLSRLARGPTPGGGRTPLQRCPSS